MFRSRLKTHLQSTGFMLTFSVTLLLVLYSNIAMLLRYQGTDISKLPSAFFAFLLCELAPGHLIFRTIFPVLAILPGAFAYSSDKANGYHIYAVSRCDKRNYYRSTLSAAFTSSFLAMLIPMSLSVFLMSVTFPMIGSSEFGYQQWFLNDLLSQGRYFYFPAVFVVSPVTTCLISAISVSLLAGLYTVVTICFSFFFYKPQVVLLLPVYLFSYASDVYMGATKNIHSYNLLDLCGINFARQKPEYYPVCFLIIVVAFIIFSVKWKESRDVL